MSKWVKYVPVFVAVADGFSDTIVAVSKNRDDAVRIASIAGLKHISDDDGANALGFTKWEQVRDYFGVDATELPMNCAVYKNMDDQILYGEATS